MKKFYSRTKRVLLDSKQDVPGSGEMTYDPTSLFKYGPCFSQPPPLNRKATFIFEETSWAMKEINML